MSRCNAQHPKLPEIRCQRELGHRGDHYHGAEEEVYCWQKYLTVEDYREPEDDDLPELTESERNACRAMGLDPDFIPRLRKKVEDRLGEETNDEG